MPTRVTRSIFSSLAFTRGDGDGSRFIPRVSLDHRMSLRHEYFHPATLPLFPLSFPLVFLIAFSRRKVRRPEEPTLRSRLYRMCLEKRTCDKCREFIFPCHVKNLDFVRNDFSGFWLALYGMLIYRTHGRSVVRKFVSH